MTCRVIYTTHTKTNCSIPKRTKAKILQHKRLDENRFFSMKLRKQTKNCTNIFEGQIKILGTDVVKEFLTLN